MENNNKKNIFETLNAINVSGKTEKKNGLTYLSWAYAWAEVKKLYPDAQYKVYERDTQYGPVNYFTDGKTCWVKVGVTIEGLEHVEMLPVMNFKNQSIPLDKVTSCDVNKGIQRAITKAISRHGLGLYVYAKEDLPECESQAQPVVVKPVEKATAQAVQPAQAPVKKDTRPVTDQMISFIRDSIKERGLKEEFICKSYKIGKLEDLQVYQAKHICKNLDKLKQMFDNEKKEHLADIVKNTKPKEMPTSFNEAICSSQQKDDDKEPIDLESLGLTEKDIQELTDLGKVFS